MRIAKRIAESGIASRREAERLIEAGRISVNGEQITSPALNVEESDKILLDGKPLPETPKEEIYAFNKPRGVLTTRNDDRGRQTIYDILPEKYQNWHYIGRLDYASEGLLLLTTSPELKRKMEMGDQKRVYRIKVEGVVDKAKLQKLERGITVKGIRYKPLKAVLDKQNDKYAWLTVTLTEGKNREIRRIFDSLRYPVMRLIRIAYGNYKLEEK